MTVISVVCTSFGPGLWVVLGLPSRRDRDGRMTREDFSIDYPGKVRKGFDSGGALGGLRLCMPDEQRGERQGEKKTRGRVVSGTGFRAPRRHIIAESMIDDALLGVRNPNKKDG